MKNLHFEALRGMCLQSGDFFDAFVLENNTNKVSASFVNNAFQSML